MTLQEWEVHYFVICSITAINGAEYYTEKYIQ